MSWNIHIANSIAHSLMTAFAVICLFQLADVNNKKMTNILVKPMINDSCPYDYDLMCRVINLKVDSCICLNRETTELNTIVGITFSALLVVMGLAFSILSCVACCCLRKEKNGHIPLEEKINL